MHHVFDKLNVRVMKYLFTNAAELQFVNNNSSMEHLLRICVRRSLTPNYRIMSERHEGGPQALLSCLSKLTCFHKEDNGAVQPPQKSPLESNPPPAPPVAFTQHDASKREQTKRWLQDLSTVAEYDVTAAAQHDVMDNQYDDAMVAATRAGRPSNGSGGNQSRVAHGDVQPSQRSG